MVHQVNSAQDYLTERKRQIIAATYASTPPPQSRKYNSTYIAAVANGANQYNVFSLPTQAATGVGAAIGGTTTTSMCCLPTAFRGTFSTVNTPGQLRVRDLNLAMSYRAT